MLSHCRHKLGLLGKKLSRVQTSCTVNLASIMTIEKARLGDKCGMLNQDKMAEVDKAIKRSLGLDG